MSLIAQTHQLAKDAAALAGAASAQQHAFFTLVDGMVRLHQQHRLAKNYEASDALRALLNAAGVQIVQGTGGYAYDKIPPALRGRPIGDSWIFDPSRPDAGTTESNQ